MQVKDRTVFKNPCLTQSNTQTVSSSSEDLHFCWKFVGTSSSQNEEEENVLFQTGEKNFNIYEALMYCTFYTGDVTFM